MIFTKVWYDLQQNTIHLISCFSQLLFQGIALGYVFKKCHKNIRLESCENILTVLLVLWRLARLHNWHRREPGARSHLPPTEPPLNLFWWDFGFYPLIVYFSSSLYPSLYLYAYLDLPSLLQPPTEPPLNLPISDSILGLGLVFSFILFHSPAPFWNDSKALMISSLECVLGVVFLFAFCGIE